MVDKANNEYNDKLINHENTHGQDFNTFNKEDEIKSHQPHIFKESSYR